MCIQTEVELKIRVITKAVKQTTINSQQTLCLLQSATGPCAETNESILTLSSNLFLGFQAVLPVGFSHNTLYSM
jgi:hypothetical protein